MKATGLDYAGDVGKKEVKFPLPESFRWFSFLKSYLKLPAFISGQNNIVLNFIAKLNYNDF